MLLGHKRSIVMDDFTASRISADEMEKRLTEIDAEHPHLPRLVQSRPFTIEWLRERSTPEEKR